MPASIHHLFFLRVIFVIVKSDYTLPAQILFSSDKSPNPQDSIIWISSILSYHPLSFLCVLTLSIVCSQMNIKCILVLTLYVDYKPSLFFLLTLTSSRGLKYKHSKMEYNVAQNMFPFIWSHFSGCWKIKLPKIYPWFHQLPGFIKFFIHRNINNNWLIFTKKLWSESRCQFFNI